MILCSNSLKQINLQVAETLSKSIQSGATTEDILDYIKHVGSKKPETVIYTQPRPQSNFKKIAFSLSFYSEKMRWGRG